MLVKAAPRALKSCFGRAVLESTAIAVGGTICGYVLSITVSRILANVVWAVSVTFGVLRAAYWAWRCDEEVYPA